MGHPPLLSYMSIGMGECRENVRAQMIEVSVASVGCKMEKADEVWMQKMIQPVGKPPEVQD